MFYEVLLDEFFMHDMDVYLLLCITAGFQSTMGAAFVSFLSHLLLMNHQVVAN